MTTRRKTSTSGFSSEKEISEVIYITEPSTPEELESEVETAAQFIEAAEEEIVEEVKVEESLVDGGTQLFFGCYKEDYIGIDGDTYKIFCYFKC
jgi:hypothetical protein